MDMEILKAKYEMKDCEVKSLMSAATAAREAYDAINARLKEAIDEKGEIMNAIIEAKKA